MSMTESRSATVTVGAALAETLARAGVKIAFTVPGESLLGLLDGLNEQHVRIVVQFEFVQFQLIHHVQQQQHVSIIVVIKFVV